MKKCKFCGEQISDDAAICPYCSESQDKEVKLCPYCEELIDADAVRCPICGEAQPCENISLEAKTEGQQPRACEHQEMANNAASMDAREKKQARNDEPSAHYKEAEIKLSSHKRIYGVVAVCITVIAIGVACLFFGLSDNSKSEASEETADSIQTDRVIDAEIISIDDVSSFSDGENESEESENVEYAITDESTEYSYNDGIYPFTSSRLCTEEDLMGLSAYDLKIMRNEILARHGYIFKTDDLKEYFEAQSWYSPQSTDVSSQLNEIERKNIAFIKAHE